MSRILIALFSLTVLGCRLPSDREELKPLDEKKLVLTYSELYLRARSQANFALESFYGDAWQDLEIAAQGLEQTARLLPKAPDTPADAKVSAELQADAAKLGEAARAKDVRAVNDALQRIQFNVRTLRPKKNDE